MKKWEQFDKRVYRTLRKALERSGHLSLLSIVSSQKKVQNQKFKSFILKRVYCVNLLQDTYEKSNSSRADNLRARMLK
ncbi:hypothetical protein C9J03_25310 [Photobacterium gaetbulicola]|nr:hypothetical protein C9J03_25310 [Photobacterium gaetbulicola]